MVCLPKCYSDFQSYEFYMSYDKHNMCMELDILDFHEYKKRPFLFPPG